MRFILLLSIACCLSSFQELTVAEESSANDDKEKSVRNLRTTSRNANLLGFKWDSPLNDDSIEQFTIFYAPDGVKSRKSVNVTTNEYTFYKLLACTCYVFEFRVRSSRRQYSSVVHHDCTMDRTPPSAMDLRFVEENGKQYVMWDPPSTDTECVHGYKLKFTQHDISFLDVVLSRNSTRYKTDYFSCTDYDVNLYTLGTNGFSSKPAQERHEASLAKSRDEFSVDSLEYKLVDATTVKLQWASASPFQSCYGDFLISYYDDNHLHVIPTRKNTYEISGLNACSVYKLLIYSRSTYKELLGRPKEVVIRTGQKAPGPVTNVSVNVISPELATVQWSLPTQFPACVNSYKVVLTNHFGKETVRFTNDLTAELNLEPCTGYTVNIAAVNDDNVAGSLVSYEFVSSTKEPSEVKDVRAIDVDKSLFVEFVTPSTASRCVTHYQVDVCDLHDGVCTTQKIVEKQGSTSLKKRYSFSIRNPVPCASYNVSIMPAALQNGSAVSNVFRAKDEIFRKPTPGKAIQVTASSATIDWHLEDSNLCSLLYTAVECLDTSTNEVFVSRFKAKNEFERTVQTVLSSLKPFVSYSCRAAFENKAGVSEFSENVKFSTFQSNPSNPVDLQALLQSDRKVKIVWQPPALPNGILDGYKIRIRGLGPSYAIPPWCAAPPRLDFTTVTGDTVFEIANLNPSESYTIEVCARNKAGQSDWTVIQVVTQDAEPCIVSDLKYLSLSYSSYIVSWRQPCYSNGQLKYFEVEATGNRNNHPPHIVSKTVSVDPKDISATYSVTFEKLLPSYNYTVQVRANIDGNVSSLTFEVPPTIPARPSFAYFKKKVSINTQDVNIPGTQVKIKFTNCTFNNWAGNILYYSVIIARDVSSNWKLEKGELNPQEQWPTVGVWSSSVKHNFLFSYQVTPNRWMPFVNGTTQVVFVIGDEECDPSSNSTCNGPLKPETNYLVKLRAFTAAGYQDSPYLRFTTANHLLKSLNGNEVRKALFNHQVVIIRLRLMMTTALRTSLPFKDLKRCIEFKFKYFFLPIVIVLLFCAFAFAGLYYVRLDPARTVPILYELKRLGIMTTHSSAYPPPSVSVKKFPEHAQRMLKSADLLKTEFDELNKITSLNSLKQSNNIAKTKGNSWKNRYLNIIPYDSNRVVINTDLGDYINASFIEGYKGVPRKYIACQGPIPDTCSDFWIMVFQQPVAIVVMLCQVNENKKTVCEKYYPELNEKMEFDYGITVACLSHLENSLFVLRNLMITKMSERKMVQHIHFKEWPDFGTPTEPSSLVDLCNAVRKIPSPTVVVHCSAGVGRTGTFICCDILLQHIADNKSLNIFNTVLKLRVQRVGMVQSEDQYRYLYRCIYHAIENN